MKEFRRLCTFDALYRAFQQTKKGKRHKTEVIQFEENLSIELTELQESLLNGSYTMSKYKQFYVYEPKKRAVFACSYRDRIVLRWLCDQVLSPLLLPLFIYDNGACQPKKGPQFSRKRLTYHLSSFYKKHQTSGYALVCDISRYFVSIDQQILKNKLSVLIKNPFILSLVELIIDSFQELDTGKGLPLGNQTSQLFALLYLHSLDQLIKEEFKITYYVRYMDDFILIHSDKSYLESCHQQLMVYLKNNLLLEMNPKTSLIPIQSGIPYLGYRFMLTHSGRVRMKLKKESFNRIVKRIRHTKLMFSVGACSSRDVQAVLLSIKNSLDNKSHTYFISHSYRSILFERKKMK